MLEYLRIEHLILVKKAELAFAEGLNILTGETGSGKSAVLTAIRLLLGEKADPQWVRTGSELALVEGRFRLAVSKTVCEQEGLERTEGPHLIRRELTRSGKSRCFFNDQQISLATLRKLLAGSIERIDQNSSIESERDLLDLWAGLDTAPLSASYSRALALEKKIAAMRAEKETAHAALARARADWEEIEAVQWKEGEEAALAEEHHRLTHAEQWIERLNAVLGELSEPPMASLLRRLSTHLSFDPSLSEAADLLKSASVETQEAEQFLQKALHRLEVDPARLEAVELRIGAIEKLKRRFGNIEETRQALQAKIAALCQHDDTLLQCEEELKELAEQNRREAARLSAARAAAAVPLQQKLQAELASLNLPHARFAVELAPKALSADGADQIRFLFCANPGHPLLPLDECASGGERSRLLFAFKVLFAKKERCACFIFDEIDSNVGGHTAAILGQKLQELAQGRQVICVTHFVQVARCAPHHFLVAKSIAKGETATEVQKLDLLQREIEYARMIGKIK